MLSKSLVLVLLPEISVRSLTLVYVPRSLPLLKVGIAIRFVPVKVAKAVYQCWKRNPTALEAGEATVCLTIHKGSHDQLGECFSKIGSRNAPSEAEQSQEHKSLDLS